MKPQFLKVSTPIQQSFSVRFDSVPYFYNHWHYHPEVELLYIVNARGTQFIGDNISNFKDGDLLLVGPNLPHLWRCEEKYYSNVEGLNAEAIVIHFLPTFWGEDFLRLPEMASIRKLLQDASKGLYFTASTGDSVGLQMKSMLRLKSNERIPHLLSILNALASAPAEQVKSLSLTEPTLPIGHIDSQRLNDIYSFTLSNFQSEIRIETVSDLVSMNKFSFCRFFKLRTGKTYGHFLTQVRIGKACQLLIENKMSVSQIAFDCGYNNYSNFSRQFKEETGFTPLDYRKAHRR